MIYKPDFEEIVSRMDAWWRGEILDRACIAIRAGNGKPGREMLTPASIQEKWTNLDYLLDLWEDDMERTSFYGEAIPFFRANLWPDTFSACLGIPLEFAEHTSWATPIIGDWDHPPSFHLDRSSFAWRWLLEGYRRAAERCPGRYLLAVPDVHAGGDCLLAMRGGERLCLDIYDHPEAIHRAMKQLTRTVAEFYEELFSIFEATGQRGHTTGVHAIWSSGRSAPMQVDLLAMLAPWMFKEFFIDEVKVQLSLLQNSIFHLDGVEALVHRPVLYDLCGKQADGSRATSLAGIQWVPGAGRDELAQWLPLLKEMQSHGANVELFCRPAEVETLMTELSSRGLFLITACGTEEEAEDLLKLAARLTHD